MQSDVTGIPSESGAAPGKVVFAENGAPLRRVILTGEEATALSSQLQSMEEQSASPEPSEPQIIELGTTESDAVKNITLCDNWQVYYDSTDYAFTVLGWWLSESNGNWLLRIPIAVPGIPDGFYSETSDPADILEKIGLEKGAAALRNGSEKTIGRALERVGVRPFARFRCTSSNIGYVSGDIKRKEGESGSERRDRYDVVVTLDRVYFDLKYAEDQRIADMLFTQGAEAVKQLHAAVADFNVPNSSEDMPRATEAVYLALREHKLERWEPPMGICPRLLAYMWALRPVHLRKLSRCRAVPQWTPPGICRAPKVPPNAGAGYDMVE